jgi:RND superfamily putative drug exporter
MVGSVGTMVQAGFIIGCGLLLDTFLVRTLTVPAIATLLREASWWPQRAKIRERKTEKQ